MQSADPGDVAVVVEPLWTFAEQTLDFRCSRGPNVADVSAIISSGLPELQYFCAPSLLLPIVILSSGDLFVSSAYHVL